MKQSKKFIQLVYGHQWRSVMKISSTNKKRSHDEVEQDGFKELLSVEEEDEFRKSEEEITELSNATANMDL